ncbi:MAG TPA: type II toxin-antitoxin system RelE/ParE family toxin [Thermoanaerobaculia bacterium]|nr:type II toxin-antitoxin system RelE/ParE family toxin [Thermoanaerobaculia bacterium]
MTLSLEDLRALPGDARRDVGHQLDQVQQGLEPEDWKSMSAVGPGVFELRIHTSVQHRVFYVAKVAEGIYVLHDFLKKKQRTSRSNIEIGRNRYRDVVKNRQAPKRLKGR